MPKVTLDLIPRESIDDVVSINSFKVTYCQNADTNSDPDEVQFLTIEAKNNGAGEDGWYYDLETEHWSIANPEQIASLIEDFKARMSVNTIKGDDIKCYDLNE